MARFPSFVCGAQEGANVRMSPQESDSARPTDFERHSRHHDLENDAMMKAKQILLWAVLYATRIARVVTACELMTGGAVCHADAGYLACTSLRNGVVT